MPVELFLVLSAVGAFLFFFSYQNSSPSTYVMSEELPHWSHFVFKLYLALVIAYMSITASTELKTDGPLLVLLYSLWLLVSAFASLMRYFRNK